MVRVREQRAAARSFYAAPCATESRPERLRLLLLHGRDVCECECACVCVRGVRPLISQRNGICLFAVYLSALLAPPKADHLECVLGHCVLGEYALDTRAQMAETAEQTTVNKSVRRTT